tara:strand:- start:292 stop:465 length:174 start_codon:yes stop_codon:yes gene_type:complete
MENFTQTSTTSPKLLRRLDIVVGVGKKATKANQHHPALPNSSITTTKTTPKVYWEQT